MTTDNKINPIFICGALRSGSTVFHLMLNSHPNIINPGEYDFLFDQVTENGEFPNTSDYIEYLLSDRIFNSTSLNIDDSLGYSDLIKSFISQLKEDGKFFAINIHRNFEHAHRLFPDAKYIHLLRDPRDVARSSIGMTWAGNVYYGVDHWIDTEKSWDKLTELLDDEQYIEVRFEDLISDAVSTLKTVCEFIGTSYTDKMFDYENKSTYSKPDISLINQWKRKLNAQELQNVEYKVLGMMSSRNYDLSGHPVTAPSIFDRIQLYLQNRLFRIHKGIERYGLVLFFLHRVTGRLKLESWHTLLKKKINVIDNKYLK